MIHHIRLIGLLLSACSVLLACQTHSKRPPSDIRAATDKEMAQVKPEWIEKKCNVGLIEELFVACVTVAARQMPVLDVNRREQFGEHYDPAEWLECMKQSAESGKRGDGGCDMFKTRRVENPEYWPNPSMPPVQWPAAPKDPVYRSWMTSRHYFEALCKAEAGEFIYKTVSDVEGVYLVRPMNRVNTGDVFDKYAPPAPYVRARGLGRRTDSLEFDFVGQGKYTFFEKPLAFHLSQIEINRSNNRDSSYLENSKISSLSVARYSGFIGLAIPNGTSADVAKKMKAEYAPQVKARYGLTWREIRRHADFEKSVVGSEVAIVDLNSGEILALTRGFSMAEQVSNAPSGMRNWLHACPLISPQRHSLYFFAEAVLKPATH
ncbi:hypothetical protein [Undibacterium sp. Ren11W]|uniref:hypothetical protein n=1 Tax=Undibacterium sp. Ren11W TaxID=3413045 RepID=UPI003BF02361